MNRFIYILLLCFFTNANPSFAQLNITNAPVEKACGTPDRDTLAFDKLPWVGNNQYLYDLLREKDYPITSNGMMYRIEAGVNYRIPVKFWINEENILNLT